MGVQGGGQHRTLRLGPRTRRVPRLRESLGLCGGGLSSTQLRCLWVEFIFNNIKQYMNMNFSELQHEIAILSTRFLGESHHDTYPIVPVHRIIGDYQDVGVQAKN